MLRVGSDFSGVGAFDQALLRIGLNYEKVFSCDMDKYARDTYVHNYGTEKDKEIFFLKSNRKVIEKYHKLQKMVFNGLVDFSEDQKKTFDDYFSIIKELSFYFPTNVYDRDVPFDSLDIYMTSPPCQAFSIAGNREGENDERGVLFYNSHEFIIKNNPKSFIFENVKGLLSHDGGKTFRKWLDYLGGLSVNGNRVIFPHDKSVPYNIYFSVLNALDFDIPQNRDRIFIVGIRKDFDKEFRFPKPMQLNKKLKDILEVYDAYNFKSYDDYLKYIESHYLSKKMIESFTRHAEKHRAKGTGFIWKPKTEEDVANCLRANSAICPTDNTLIVGNLNKGGQRGVVYSEDSKVMSCLSASDLKQPKQIMQDNIIRKLTVREYFRLMDFDDKFDPYIVSNSQSYKQAGNSICVGVLERIIINILKVIR